MILQLASYDLLIFVFQDSLPLLISLICIYASLLPIFPFFLIMSKGGERCMHVCLFPLMFKREKDIFQVSLKTVKVICLQEVIHLGGDIHLRGRNISFWKHQGIQDEVLSSSKRGRMEYQPLIQDFQMFWWQQNEQLKMKRKDATSRLGIPRFKMMFLDPKRSVKKWFFWCCLGAIDLKR